MHDGGMKGVREESRERGIAKGNGAKREGWVETAAKSLDKEGMMREGVGGGSGRQ